MHLPFHLRQPGFDHAIERLRKGRAGESGYGRRIALLLTIPTYEDPVARDVRRSPTGELYVVRTVWQRSLDSSAMRPARAIHVGGRSLAIGLDLVSRHQPSLVSTRVRVDVDALDSLLGTLATTTVTCHVQQAEPPLDSTIFELTVGQDLTEMRYRWAAHPPEGWTPIAAFSSRLIHLVDGPVGVAAQ